MKQIIILPDTNIWLNELTKNKSKELDTLKFWISKGIEILVPDLIEEEWERNKEAVLEKYEIGLKSQYSVANKILKKRFDGQTLASTEVQKLRLERIGEIEELLNTGKKFSITNEIKLKVIDLSKVNKAPFHKDKNNNNDAQLFLSGIEYIKGREDHQLIFLSENYTDFTEGKAKRDKLHPDLVELVGDQDVLFFNNIGSLIANYEGLPKVELDSNDISDDKTQIFKSLEKSLSGVPIIKAMHQALEEIYTEVNFIPPHFFRDIYPFNLSEAKHQSYYNDLHFTTNNPEIIEVFKSLTINDEIITSEDSEIQSQIDDIIEIVKALNSNLIYSISERGKDNIQIKHQDQKECDCCICLFHRMQFSESWRASFRKEEDSLKEIFKKAFACYLFKDYKRSYQYLHLVREESSKEGKTILHYLCSFNLSKIKSQFDWKLGDSDEEREIKDYLESIDTRKEIAHLYFSGFENIRLLNWVNDGWYYQHMIYYGNKLLQEIRRYKKSIERGGSGYVTSITNLICDYAEFDYFLNRNCVIFHHFLEFDLIHRNFLEALFLAYTMPENASSRLEKFDDYFVQKVIFYCENKDVINTIIEFKIETIKYAGSGVQRWLENSLSDFDEFESLVDKKEIEIRDFHHTYERVLPNLLVFAGIIEFDDNKEREYLDLILEFFKKDKKFRMGGDLYNGFTFYINRKSKYFDDSSLLKLINLVVHKQEFHRENILGSVNYMITNDHDTFEIGDERLVEYIIKICLDECDLCQTEKHDDDSIGLYYQLFSHEGKLKVTNRITSILQDEFYPDLYITSSLFEIIDWKSHWDTYLEYCLKSIEKPRRTPFHRNEDDEYPIVRDMINLAYKVGIDLSNEKYSKFRGLSDYFDWLLDIENFDYSKFKPHWVNLINTKSYWDRYKKSKSLKMFLNEYLEKNKNDTLLKKYFNLYSD